MTDFMKYFDAEMNPKLGIRAPTFRAVIREALHQDVMSIVETGCLRKEDNWAGDGQSTLIWDAYRRFSLGDFTSIDISEEAISLIRKLCPDSTSICGDSVEALNRHIGAIDLLYLDSFDLDTSNEHPAALHCLFEFCAARPHLHPGSILFIDDSPMGQDWIVAGKGRYVAQYMKQLAVNPFTFGYQVAYLMP